MKPMKHFFTLIEILTVAAIIAILAGISVGVIGLISNKNAEAKTQATIKSLELALGQYKADTGCIYMPKGLYEYDASGPKELNKPVVLKVTVGIPDKLDGTLLKYMDQKLLNSASQDDGTVRYFVDGWGRPLIYRIPGKFNKTGYDLGSVGPDGKVGDGAKDDDVISESKLPEDGKEKRNYSNFGQGDDITNFLRKD